MIKFLLLSFLILSSSNSWARPEWMANKVREQKKMEAIEQQVNSIPLYEEKLQGAYEILGAVHGQDIVSRNKDSIFAQVRLMAYKMEADAVMEFKCDKVLKSVFQSCEGFAIKYTSPSSPQE